MEGGKTGGGEVRKVHIVYFLSHGGGKIEQPHLIRVHHLHRSGVHLRDVKRWLSEVRGKDMPDSYAWSYKRRYKLGYVWQDLKDDDLITPFSDNEYVLKGSEISTKNESPSLEAVASEEEARTVQGPKTPRRSMHVEVVGEGISPKTPSPPDQESPGALRPPPLSVSVSDVSDESLRRAAVFEIDLWKQIQDEQKNPKAEIFSVTNHHRKESDSEASYWWSGRKKSSLLRNLLNCRAVDTNNSVVHRTRKDVSAGNDTDNKHTAKKSASTNSRMSLKKMQGRNNIYGIGVA